MGTHMKSSFWVSRSAIGMFLICLTVVPLRSQILGGMLDPSLDKPGEPFSYFWHPSDVIGSLYSPVASEVTPEGSIFTGFGELMFLLGNPLVPINKRVKTLYKGSLPIVQFEISQGGIKYDFTMFSANLGEKLEGLATNFVQVFIRNPGKVERTAFVSSAFRSTGPNNRLEGGPADFRFTQRFDLLPK